MTPSTPATARQVDVLRAIGRFADAHGYAPTVRDLAEALEISSTNGANDHIEALEARGLVVRTPNRARSLRLTPAGQQLATSTTPVTMEHTKTCAFWRAKPCTCVVRTPQDNADQQAVSAAASDVESLALSFQQVAPPGSMARPDLPPTWSGEPRGERLAKMLARWLEVPTQARGLSLANAAFANSEGCWSVMMVRSVGELVHTVATGSRQSLRWRLLELAAFAVRWAAAVERRG